MKDASSNVFQSFQSLLDEKLEEAFAAPQSDTEPISKYCEGADLGLGLLNELFHGLHRKSRPVAKAPLTDTPPPPPPKALSPAEEKALEFFTVHGVRTLNGNSSLAEFKRGFRLLAKKLHPDSMPHASPIEKSRLAADFRKLKEHYQVLMFLAHRSE
jgi:hypothetical protein